MKRTAPTNNDYTTHAIDPLLLPRADDVALRTRRFAEAIRHGEHLEDAQEGDVLDGLDEEDLVTPPQG